MSGAFYSASYMSQTRDQKCFAISEVEAELLLGTRVSVARPDLVKITEPLYINKHRPASN